MQTKTDEVETCVKQRRDVSKHKMATGPMRKNQNYCNSKLQTQKVPQIRCTLVM